MDDTISRQAALDALNEQIGQCNKALGSFDISLKDEFAIKVERASLEAYKEQLENLPPAEPRLIRCRDCEFWTKQEASLQGRCALTGTYPTGAFFCGNARRRPYLCDPEKNTTCSKTGCYINGGECRHTLNREYRKEEE